MNEPGVPVFLSGGGEVGALLRTHDWSTSPLGHPAQWPQSLRSVVGLILNSKFPMFVAWGPELGFLYNDSYAEILGGKHPAALGGRFEEIWREIWSDIHPIIVQALGGQASFHTHLPLTINRRGFDESAWFTFSYSPVRDESGAVAGMYCAVNETTVDVLNERNRIEENERLQRLFEQAPGIMAVLRGPDHVFELANVAYLELVGNRQLLGKPLRVALPELDGQGFYELLDHVYASGEVHRGHAAPVRLQRGAGELEERYIDFVYQPIRTGAGSVTGIFVEGHDVTAAVAAKNELLAASRRKDEFLAMLAHELRNPLAPISSAADLLRLAGPESALVRQTSAIITRQVKHMTGLVDDLLDVSRVTRGLVSLQKETLDLNGVVADAIEQVLPLMQARRQKLSLQLPAEPVLMQGDRTRLVQVFANVLNNAAKYTPGDGRIDVGLELTPDAVEFRVRDDGVGMPSELLPHVFELFSQAERSPDRSQGGLGLGLALVKSLVGLHGGSVSAHSDGPGLGSRFAVRLPYVAGALQAAEPHLAVGAVGTRPTPLRLMVVDDNTDAANILCLLLEALGHTASAEHDAEQAIARARRQVPQMLFLDIGLPDMDGYELARRLKAMPETRDAVFVAVTGYGQPDDKERARQAGFDHHMVKPVKLTVVRELLDDYARTRAG
jgi:signal transduction histidine kinase/ActR/RegA family two-component response regulator